MLSRKIALASVILLMAVPSAYANIVVNGGFETGDFTGWTVSAGATGVTTAGFDGFNPHSGTYFANLGNVGCCGSLSQTFSTIAGQTLTLDYFLAADGGTPSHFEADWNGVAIAGSVLDNSASSGYIEHTFNVVATGSDTLRFLERNDPGYWAFDDISLNVASDRVPEPASLAVLGGGLLALGFSLRRRRAKQAV